MFTYEEAKEKSTKSMTPYINKYRVTLTTKETFICWANSYKELYSALSNMRLLFGNIKRL